MGLGMRWLTTMMMSLRHPRKIRDRFAGERATAFLTRSGLIDVAARCVSVMV